MGISRDNYIRQEWWNACDKLHLHDQQWEMGGRFRFSFPHYYIDSYVITVKMILKVGANLLTIYVGSMSEVVVAGESIDASHHYGTSLPLNSPNEKVKKILKAHVSVTPHQTWTIILNI